MSPKKTPIINDFRAGELTPCTDARPDLKDYYRGCRILEGMMPIIEGGVARVPGTYYVRPVKQIEEGWSLRVTKSGTGTGVVTSDVAGINCGVSCYYFFPAGSTVVLTAIPDAGSSFAGWLGDGTGMVTRSVLMDGNKVVNVGFALGDPYLIGWYKFNEGNGSIVNNYAVNGGSGGGLLPNLTVVNTIGTFWSFLSGFATSNGSAFAHATITPRAYGSAVRGKACHGIFFKHISGTTWGTICKLSAVNDNSVTSGTEFVTQPSGNVERYNVVWKSTQEASPYVHPVVNWYFLFFLDIGGVSKTYLVYPNGTLYEPTHSLDTSGVVNLIYILAGGRYYSGSNLFVSCYSSYGDWIIYNNKTLTLAEWAVWYDLLRSRYGMATRVGW